MSGFSRLSQFVSDESGVVSVDWVVLSAGMVGLGLAVTNVVAGGLEDLSHEIRENIAQDHHIQRSFRDPSQNIQVGGPDEWDVQSGACNEGVGDGDGEGCVEGQGSDNSDAHAVN